MVHDLRFIMNERSKQVMLMVPLFEEKGWAVRHKAMLLMYSKQRSHCTTRCVSSVAVLLDKMSVDCRGYLL